VGDFLVLGSRGIGHLGSMKWIGIGTSVVVFAFGLATAVALRSGDALHPGAAGAPPEPTVTGAPVRPPAAAPPPSAAPEPAPPARDLFDEIDRALEKMEDANVAFNAPSALDLGERTEIQLLLSLRKPIRVLEAELEAGGVKEGANVRVSPLVEARLTGLGFAIEALTKQQQPVGRKTDAEWRWEIEGRQEGAQRLHLTLTAFVPVDGPGGRPVTRTIDTFDRTISIQVSWGRRTTDFIDENWQWLWAAIVVPIAGAALQIVRRGRRSHPPTRPEGADTPNALVR
jgi:hypothetical protein